VVPLLVFFWLYYNRKPLSCQGVFEKFFILFCVSFDNLACFKIHDFGFGYFVIVPNIANSYHVGRPFAVEQVGVAGAVIRGGSHNLEHFCFSLFLFSD
jgi:hypothetical protein